MWYLTAELVVLSFFDKDVSSEAEILMAKELQTFEKPTVFDGGKPKFLTNIFDDTTIQLHDFVDENSWFLLEQATSFLYVTKNTPESPWSQLLKDPKLWPEAEDFQMLALWVHELPVTNDAAERAVKDAQDVAHSAHSPDVRESIMIVKTEHRRKFKKLSKLSLNFIND